MARGLLVSDHPLLNDLYSFNLKAFVDLELMVKTSLSEALTVLRGGSQGDIIITLSRINDEDCGESIVDTLEELKADTPVVVIGERSSVSNTNKVYTLPPNLNVPIVVKKSAEILGVTAKDMMAKEVPDHYPVALSLMENFDVSPCEIFVLVSKTSTSGEFVKLCDSGAPFQGKVREYKEKGTVKLYIPSSERLKVVNQVSKIVIEKLDDPSLEPDDRIRATESGYDLVGGLLGEAKEVTPEVIKISKKCMEAVANIIKEVPRVKGLLLTILDNKTGYLYLHSVMGTYIARHIVREISWGSEEHAEKLSFVFFFHDMFLAPIFSKHPSLQFEEDAIFKEELSDKEKEVVLNHARLASEMVKTFPRCPMGSDAIILQHHGMTNGVGFTLDYKDDISPLAKVLIVSEAFVEELIRYKDANKGPDLEHVIEVLRAKFTKHTYKKIIDCLETISF